MTDKLDATLLQEKALVGSLLWKDEHQAERVREARATTREWSVVVVPQHRIILAALEKVLSRNPSCDLVMLHGELAATGKLDAAGGADALTSLVDGVPHAADANTYAKDLVRLAMRRKALQLTKLINERVAKGEELNGELEELGLAALDATALVMPERSATWMDVTHAPIVTAEQILAASEAVMEYVIEPLAPRGYLMQIHGPPKGGKSSFMLFLAVAGAIGTWPDKCPIKSGALRVLYITWEDMLPILSKRILSYARGLGSDGIPPNLHVVEMPDLLMNIPSNAEIFERTITDGKYDLVVLDTISHAHAVDEDRASEIKPVMHALARAARSCRCSIAYVHHRRKSHEGISMSERGRGSTAIGAAPVSIVDWGDRGESDVTPVKVTTKLDFRANWEVEYIREGDDSVRWSIRDTEAGKKRSGGGPEGVFQALQTLIASGTPSGDVAGSQLVAVMADQGISKAQVYRHLKTLETEGKVSSRMHGRSTFYSLKTVLKVL